jgi:hypothetical protein
MSRPLDPKQFGHRNRHSNRRGSTLDTHHQTGARVPPVRFTCDLCAAGEVWSVALGQTVLAAQSQHRATHALALREAVEMVVQGFASGDVVAVPRHAGDRSPRVW